MTNLNSFREMIAEVMDELTLPFSPNTLHYLILTSRDLDGGN